MTAIKKQNQLQKISQSFAKHSFIENIKNENINNLEFWIKEIKVRGKIIKEAIEISEKRGAIKMLNYLRGKN